MGMFIRGLISYDLLVELSESKIVIRTIGNGPKLEYEPYLAVETAGKIRVMKGVGSEAKLQSGTGVKVINPFAHPRSFVADFYVAEKLIQHGVREIHKSKIFKPAPRIIMHQLEKTEGGLTNVEERVLRELALGSGAREVVIYVGERLDSDRITFDDVKRK
ncbi:rod shape-determining protein [Vibrio rotiferianus]|uniref:Rod shape-determining protein MreB n=1 Tax=Vibrio rotiferianus TaxID=190895 RepID=A0ABX3D9C9_9VIBR|nr:rod shape-determining protein [Vibrio rotiferianus]OHY93755.1 rod shape-determining protein MreB [Vibrio rotiferianus]